MYLGKFYMCMCVSHALSLPPSFALTNKSIMIDDSRVAPSAPPKFNYHHVLIMVNQKYSCTINIYINACPIQLFANVSLYAINLVLKYLERAEFSLFE